LTDERRHSGGLASRDELLRGAIDSFTEHAFLTLDPGGIVTSWSAGAERVFGYSRAQAEGQHVSLLFSREDRQSGIPAQLLRQAEQHGSVSSTRWVAHADGSGRHVKATLVARVEESAIMGYAGLAHEAPVPAADHGEDGSRARAALEGRVQEGTRQLAESKALLATEVADRTQAEAGRIRLLRRLVVAQEEERRRIARDLHDDLGQRLTALRLSLEALEGVTGRENLSQGLGKALAILAGIDQALDFLAWDLRPAALDDLGLTNVLDNYVREWSRHSGVRAMFHAGIQRGARFAPEVEASVYRIAQEALNNVAKHAQAKLVNVLLEQRGGSVALVVEDNGIGCQPKVNARKIGLTGMSERAAAVGGTLEIEPTPNGGTTVLAHIPMAPPSHIERGRDAWAVSGSAGPHAEGLPDSTDTNGQSLSSLRARLQELQQAVAARDEFVATVAHELRNPVAPLMFQLRLAIEKSEQMAATGAPLPADWVQSQLRRIEQRLHRLLETLDRLLDVSRLSTGRIDLQPEPMNLGLAVREVISTFEAELAVARCKLVFAERGDSSGYWDRVRLEQICRNLMSNAIRFGAGRPIEVLVDADHDFATLEVRDHGVGIARDQQTRIFERFERGVEQRSGGFGIGLWVVKNICVALGGTISVESEPGEGARFTVLLPRRRDAESRTGTSEEQ
jgi:PAS domain S-box-containing protein